MPRRDTPAFFVDQPADAALALVLDSPHSGFTFPDDFRPAAPVEAIRTGWDAYLDDLWAHATTLGATLIGAHFPRTYIDANRAADDIDQALLDARWPHPGNPSDYSRRGQGLIRRFALPGVPMYDRKLSVAEVENRLDTYYRPYRAAVAEAIEQTVARHGHVWHIDLHSMKSRGNAMNLDAGQARPDFVISDRMGTTSDPAATAWIAAKFRELGYAVNINDPYKGGDIVYSYGAPQQRRHSIQIEINRAIYMDEATCEKTPRYAQLKADINRFLDAFAQRIGQPEQAFS